MPILLPDQKVIYKPINPIIDWKNPITHGLVLDIPLAENKGTIVNTSNRGTQGNFNSAPVWVATPLGPGVQFSGAATGNSISFTSPPTVNGVSTFSVEFYAYVIDGGSSTNGRFIYKGLNPAWFILWNGGLGVRANGSLTNNDNMWTGFPTKKWTHVVVTWAISLTSLPTLYINGIQTTFTTTSSGTGTLNADDTNLYIGNDNNLTKTMNGIMAYARIWNRILTQTEAAQLYTNPFRIYQESFLYKPNRYFHPLAPATVTSETEQETSQIIIDKVVQGQIGGGSTLTMDVPIPSFDASLIVTGGSVVATGGAWQSVSYNGISLTKLVQAGVAGNSAEIWYMPFPPVGTYPLVIVPTASFGQVYANAMVLLGLDKKSVNIKTASATDAAATATITANITPDAPNSIIIDALASLDAIAQPVPDASQTQVFNPTSLNTNEYVLSTFKLSSNTANNMNYNLSVSVNAALVAASFRPATHPSIWFPNVDTREIDDVVTVNGLDSGITLSGVYGHKASIFYTNSFLHTVGRSMPVITPVAKTVSYGYKPSTFYLNSFLQTIGREMKPANPVIATKSSSLMLLMGVG